MTLRDKLYFRFGLFHQRYGRIWCALLEGIYIFIAATVIGLAVFSAFNFAVWSFEQIVAQQTKAARQEAATYQNMLLACLNGGVVGRAGDEVVACEGAVTFRMAR